MNETETQVITLGGRNFVPVKNISIRMEGWIAARLNKAGIDKIAKLPGESDEELVERLLLHLYEDGSGVDLLGAFILPQGKTVRDWTPALAREQSEFIGTLTAPGDKTTFRSAFAELMIGFFRNGIVSLRISPTSSNPAEENHLPQNESDPQTNLEAGADSSAS